MHITHGKSTHAYNIWYIEMHTIHGESTHVLHMEHRHVYNTYTIAMHFIRGVIQGI